MLCTIQTFNVVVQYIVKMQKPDILKLQCVKLSVDCRLHNPSYVLQGKCVLGSQERS